MTKAPLLGWQFCFVGDADVVTGCPTDRIVKEMAWLMTKNKFTEKKLYEMVLTNFGRGESYVTLLGLVEKDLNLTLNSDKSADRAESCKSKKCKQNIEKLEKYLQLLYLSTNGNMQEFGTALQTLINMKKPKKQSRFITFESADFNEQDVDCYRGPNRIKSGENYLHNYFRNLSKLMGFTDQELVSLYDLPGMLSYLDRYHRERYHGPHAFLFTRCQQKDFHDRPVAKFSKCFAEWDAFKYQTSKESSFDPSH